MTTTSKTVQTRASGLFNKIAIRDLAARTEASDEKGRTRVEAGALADDDLLFVAGGRMSARATCSGGCCDDC
ncbi:hypothetical protein [Methylobacterium sp. JK268]